MSPSAIIIGSGPGGATAAWRLATAPTPGLSRANCAAVVGRHSEDVCQGRAEH